MGKQELLITLGMQDATFQQKIKAVNRQLKLTDANFETLKAKTKNFGKSQKDLAQEFMYLSKKLSEVKTNLDTYGKRIKDTTKSISDSEKKHEQLTKQIAEEGKKLNELKATQGKSSQAYKDQKEKVDGLRTELDRCDRSLITHKAALQNAQVGYAQTETQIAKLEGTLGRVKAKFDAFKIDKLATQFQNVGNKMNSIGKSMMSVGSTLTASVTTPIVGFGAVATKTFIDFEEQVRRTNAIIDKGGMDNQKSYDAIMSKSRELGRTTIFTAQQVAEGMSYMALAGWTTKESLDAVSGVLDLSAIGMTDLATASDIVTDAMTPLKMEAKDTGKFVDVMAATITRSNTDIVKLGESFKYATPVAGNLGINIQDLSLAMGLMANSGIKASSAGTSFATGMARLVNPTDKAAAAMKKYGVSVQYDAKTGSVDLLKTMENLRKSFEGVSKKQRQQAIDTIFGKTAMKGWSAVIGATAEDFNKLKDAIKNSKGATAEMLEEIEKSGAFSFKLMTSAINDMLITLGDFLAPVMTDIAKIVTDLTVKFSKWFEYMKKNEEGTLKFITRLVALAAIIGPLLVLFGGLAVAISLPIKMMGKFLKLFTPNKDGDPSKLLEGIKKGFDKVKTGGNSAFNVIKKGATSAKGVLTKFVNVGKQGLTFMKNALLGNVFSWKDLGAAISPVFTKMGNGIKGFAKVFLNFDQTVIGMVTSFKGLASKVVNAFGDGLIKGFKAVTGSTLFKVITEPLDAIATVMANSMTKLWKGMTDPFNALKGLASKFGLFKDTVLKYSIAIATSPKAAFGLLTKDLGKIFTTFKGSIVKLFPTISGILSTNLGGIVGKLSGFASTAFGVILKVIKNPFGAIKLAITTIAPMITGAFTSVVGFLGGGLASIGGALAALFNPITVVVLLVGGLIASFVHLYKTSEGFRDKVGGAMEQVKAGFIRVKDALGEVGSKLMETFGKMKSDLTPVLIDLGTKAKEVFENLKTKVSEMAAKFKEGFDKIVESASQFWSSFVGLLQANFPNIGENIMTIFEGIWGAILDGITGFIDIVITTITGLLDIFNALISGNFDQVGSTILMFLQNLLVSVGGFFMNMIINAGTILSGLLPIIGGIFTTVFQIVTGVLGSILSGIGNFCLSALSAFANWCAGVLSKIANFCSESLSNFANWCAGGLSKFAEFIADSIKKMIQWAKDLPNKVKEGTKNALEAVKNGLKNVAESIAKPFKDGYDKVQEWWGKIKGIVKNPIKAVVELVKPGKASLDMDIPNQTPVYSPQVAAASFRDMEQSFKAKSPNLADFKTSGGFYNPVSIDVKDKTGGSKSSDDNSKLLMALQKQNELLMQILLSTANQSVNVDLILDGRQVAKASAKYMNEEITKIDSRKNRLGGKM
ncbi:MAG: phage tail tape measure protein [Bacilli bacterium]|uniref:phage tail tape measure protein n=1 Tax=Clostridium sp. TaxID=1506 RepID=UPI002FC5B907